MPQARLYTWSDIAEDQQHIRDLVMVHAVGSGLDPMRIADLTWGGGRVWDGLPWYPETRLDIRRVKGITHLGDNRDLLHVKDVANHDELVALPSNYYDWVMFDPPHNAEQGETSRYHDHFGAGEASLQHAPSISHIFPPFLMQARRILKKNGILTAKLIDGPHRGRQQWIIRDFVNAVDMVEGLCPCDRRIRPSPAGRQLVGPNWDNQRHLWHDDVFWVLVRNGSCMRPL